MSRVSSPSTHGGEPASEIVIEDDATPASQAITAATTTRSPSTTKTPYPGMKTPYELFKTRFKSLGVTDLTQLAWCELRVDYEGRQEKWKPMKERPRSFNSAQGINITVDFDIMKSADERTAMGKKIHAALQQEVNPPELHMPRSPEINRWASRLVTMIDCIQSLGNKGRCREIPVIGIMHSMVVHGIIDQIQRQDLMSDAPVGAHGLGPQADGTSSSSEQKRKRTSLDALDTSSPKPKKARIQRDGSEAIKDAERAPQSCADASSSYRYQLRISDTKTRSEPGMPPESDTGPSRLQLMIYRKLLSGVLAPPSSPEAVDFDAVWTMLELSPNTQLPRNFVQSAKLARYKPLQTRWNLNELVGVFRQSVQALHFDKIADELDIVYCTQAETHEGDTDNTKLTVEERWPVIGTTTIRYDEQVVQDHLERAFEYWKGERLPEGVEEPLMERRCTLCEYKPSCEWRAQMNVD